MERVAGILLTHSEKKILALYAYAYTMVKR